MLLASSDCSAMPSRDLESSPRKAQDGPPNGIGFSVLGTLKKHKQLPHPSRKGSGDYSTPTSNGNSTNSSRGLSLETNITSPSSTTAAINASPRRLKHTSQRIIGSIDLPPTPPAHSRNSSNDANVGAPSLVVTTNGDVESPACSTPVNIHSPPTPDFTPPRPRRVEAVQNQSPIKLGREGEKRRDMGSRNDSMNTTTSFVTAREELESDHDGSSTIKGGDIMTLDGTDYALEEDKLAPQQSTRTRSLGLGLEGLEDGFTKQRTPTQESSGLRKKFSFEDGFDGDHSPKSQREQRRELPNPVLSRNVTITRGKTRRKPYNLVDQEISIWQQPSRAKNHRRSHIEQDIGKQEVREVLNDNPLSPTNATRHLEKHGVDDQNEFGRIPEVKATPRNSQHPEDMARSQRRSHTQPEKLSTIPRAKQIPSVDDPHDVRKFSHGSSRSNSTVEAVVVIQPQQLKARRTLRHKERMGSLRDFSPSYASRVPAAEKEYHIPAQRLRHKSIDLSGRPKEKISVPEKTRQILDNQAQSSQQPSLASHPLPRKSATQEETEEVPRDRKMNSFVHSGSEPREGMEPEPVPRSRQVSEQTVIAPGQREPRSRKVSDESEQTVIEHPRRSPLPEVPREQDIPAPSPERHTTHIQDIQPPQESLRSRPPVALQDGPAARPRRFSIERKPVPHRPRMDSTASNGTVTTNATEKVRSRKQLLADGVIPVVIVPSRASSLKEQSQPPSLRSSKQASRASSTAPLSASAGTNVPGAWPGSYPSSLLGQRRHSDGGSSAKSQKMTPKEDGLVRSLDTGPPAIPIRRSSMSAPTTPYGSRNVSRSNSLTADSLRRHNEDQAYAAVSYAGTLDPEQTVPPQLAQLPARRTVSQTIQQRRDENRDSGVGYGVGISTQSHSVRIEEPNLDHQKDSRQRSTHLSVDTNGDPLFGQRLSAQITPFSAKSDVTGASHGTALEVAEARQIDIFSHQNTSVQLIDQEPPSSSASESIKLRQQSIGRKTERGRPTTSSSTGAASRPDRPRLESREKYSSTSLVRTQGVPTTNLVPASPPQAGNTMTDSPLINPRQPPQPPVAVAAGPPAFNIIPPTPAELAAQEEASKQLGWGPPRDARGDVSRPPRRNWSLRAVGGLVRSLSLGSRNSVRRRRTNDVDIGPAMSAAVDDYERPAEEGKLHPFWRPSNCRDEDEDCDCDECRDYWADVDEEARQRQQNSTFDKSQRPEMPRRTTSQVSQVSKRLKKTFAILPLAGVETTREKGRDDGYNVSYATARRTIKRSGSGNLKVVNRVGNVSKESLKLQEYLNRSRRERSFRRNRFNSFKRNIGQKQGPVDGNAIEQQDPRTPPAQTEDTRKRFSWVGGSTDSPVSKYPPAVRYPPQSRSGTYDNDQASGLKRTFSLPGRSSRRGSEGMKYPPSVSVDWLSLGGLTRRFSEKRKEEKREGLRRTISAPRGVRDGVEEVLTSRQRADARRERYQRQAGVQTQDFGGSH